MASASAENQGKTIGLVLFGLLAVILAAMSWMAYDQVAALEEQETRAVAAEEQSARDAETSRQHYRDFRGLVHGPKIDADHDSLLTTLQGIQTRPNVSQARRDGDMSVYPTLQSAVETLQAKLKEVDAELLTLEQDQLAKEGMLKGVQGQIHALTEKELADQASAASQMNNELANLLNQIRSKQQEYINQYAQKTAAQNELDLIKSETDVQLARLDLLLDALRNLYVQVKQLKEESEKIAFEEEDGRILDVLGNGDRAYVNIGRQDGLRIGQTFGVHGRNVAGNPQHLPDYQLEITGLFGGNQAEGVISVIPGQEPLRPVLPGDLLYSPIWSPGKLESIAFAGVIEFDDDDAPDNLDFRGWLTRNGGAVVADVDLDTGAIRGRIAVGTNWLILGDYPDTSTGNPDINAKITESMNRLLADARDRKVPIVNTRNFMNYVANQSNDQGTGFVFRAPAPIGSSIASVGTQRRNMSVSQARVGTQERDVEYSTARVGTQRTGSQQSTSRVGTQR